MASDVARNVSSFLVPHQSSEDLMQQGVPAREARRRSVWRTRLMERLSSFLELILIWAIILPVLVAVLLGLTLFVTGVCDAIDGDTATVAITDFLFSHLTDSCDQPLGVLVIIFWISVFSKIILIVLWDRFNDIPMSDCCNSRCCRCLSRCCYYCFATPTVLFEFLWPISTLILLLLAKDCSWKLKSSTWVVLSPFILELLGFLLAFAWTPCLKPILWCTGLMTDPASLARNFPRIRFQAEIFNDDVYATNCAICLVDFAAADDIVLAPCDRRHVFHRGCLASWLRTAQTCPLCRSPLNPSRNRRDVEEALASWEKGGRRAWFTWMCLQREAFWRWVFFQSEVIAKSPRNRFFYVDLLVNFRQTCWC